MEIKTKSEFEITLDQTDLQLLQCLVQCGIDDISGRRPFDFNTQIQLTEFASQILNIVP